MTSRDLLINLTIFVNFLPFSRKFNFSCVSVFYTMYPTRSNWQAIFSKTKMFNVFLGFCKLLLLLKNLSSYCNRYTYQYIPHRDLWLSRLYFEISNSPENKCLTIDMRHLNNLGRSKVRTGAKNDK